MKNKLKEWLIKFGNAQISGESGIGTSMAIASGYQYDPKKGWVQSEENLKETEGLRNNLSFISTFSPTHPATALVEKAIVPGVMFVGSKGLPYIKQIFNTLKKSTKISKVKSSTNSLFPPNDLFVDPDQFYFLNPLGEAPYPKQVKPYQTYKDFDINKFKNVKSIKLQEPVHQSSGNRAWIDYGEYDNPLWKEFYEDILKPLNKRSRIPERKPRLVNFSDQSPKDTGVFFVGDDVALIDVKGNRDVGLHEYVSHGTDQFAKPNQWKYTYFTKPNPIKNNVIRQSTNWYEQRATFNEGRFELYLKLKDQLGRRPTLDEFQKYVDTLTDVEILNSTLFNPRNKIFNGYAEDYYYHIKHSKDFSNIFKKLRHNMKYVFGLSPIIPTLNNKEND